MSKLVRMSDEVYDRLEAIRDKRETFSEVVERLVKIHDKLGMITALAQGQLAYQEYLNEQLKEPAATH